MFVDNKSALIADGGFQNYTGESWNKSSGRPKITEYEILSLAINIAILILAWLSYLKNKREKITV